MTTDILMPRLSETSPRGTILKWLVEPGMPVKKGQPIVQVESDKAIVELEAPGAGLLQAICFREGEVVEATAILARISEPGESIEKLGPRTSVSPGAARRDAGSSDGSPATPITPSSHPRSARLVRRAKRTRLTSISETGQALTEAHWPRSGIVNEELPSHELLPLSAIRSKIGDNLLASLRTAPHAYVEVESDVTALVEWRSGVNSASVEAHPSYTALFIQAAALGLRSFPDLNASLRGSQLLRWEHINIGVAVAREDGLIVPVIPDADRLSLSQIMARLGSFGTSHQVALPADASGGGTFTISNLGMYGADSVLSIIHPGQAGILSLGRIGLKPVIRAGEFVARSMLRMTLAFDHRIVDGVVGAGFLAHIAELLTTPESWAR
jgi:pyruvate dehydrogenase E2 component (dihydrolipoamide acetyltransferase)